ncbi:MAG: hypothetical protein H6716_25285 [Polyangiaceae bacterium]|nr:hypothetical protein [Polyangiaceae bacterium]
MQIPHGKLYKVTKRLSLGAALYGLWLGVASLQSGCGDDTAESTTGKRVTLHTRVDLAEIAQAPFSNGFDWQIQLKQVELSIGELRYFEGAAIGVLPARGLERYARSTSGRRAVPPPPQNQSDLLRGWFQIPTAKAHPGHYVAGNELGEMLTPTSADLLVAPVSLADGEGVTGHYRSGWFTFNAPPTGPAASALNGSVAHVVATVTQSDVSFDIELLASKADVLDTNGVPTIEGCPFDDGAGSGEAVISGDGTIVLTIDPSHWLDQLDLSRVTPPSDASIVEITADDATLAPLHNAFARGLRQAVAYSFSFIPD